ncbi:MAG: hypothetical protein H6732_18180 [Alphaproteobacteria bacterium]|nr:hypothetical protein [Alphaproteobacteria bacterium]
MPETHEPRPLPDDRRDTLPPSAPATLDALFAAVAADTLDRPPNVRDRLRELPTPQRTGLAAAAAAIAVTVVAVQHGLRMDLTAGELLRTLAFGLALVAVGIASAALALRGLHSRPLPTAGLLGVLLLGAPALLALVPAIPGDVAPVPAVGHLACGATGLIAALAGALAVLFLDRSDAPSRWRVAGAAATGGAFGFAGGLLQCHHVEPTHLLLGHASAGVLVAALILAGQALLRR